MCTYVSQFFVLWPTFLCVRALLGKTPSTWTREVYDIYNIPWYINTWRPSHFCQELRGANNSVGYRIDNIDRWKYVQISHFWCIVPDVFSPSSPGILVFFMQILNEGFDVPSKNYKSRLHQQLIVLCSGIESNSVMLFDIYTIHSTKKHTSSNKQLTSNRTLPIFVVGTHREPGSAPASAFGRTGKVEVSGGVSALSRGMKNFGARSGSSNVSFEGRN